MVYAAIPFAAYFFSALSVLTSSVSSGFNAITGSQSIPGISGSASGTSFGGVFDFGLTTIGVVGFFMALIAMVLVLSINIFGSGIGDAAPPVISTIVVWIVPFAVVAGLGAPVIQQIPTFGTLINMALIGMYLYGVADHFGYPI
jgi:hypothetical protein